jgi:hypothetical protein
MGESEIDFRTPPDDVPKDKIGACLDQPGLQQSSQSLDKLQFLLAKEEHDIISSKVTDWVPVPKRKCLGTKAFSMRRSSNENFIAEVPAAGPKVSNFVEHQSQKFEFNAAGRNFAHKSLNDLPTGNVPLHKTVNKQKAGTLNFPAAFDCEESVTCRQVTIPTIFQSWHEYSRSFTEAVYEEINLRVRETALAFYKACQVSADISITFDLFCQLFNSRNAFDVSGYTGLKLSWCYNVPVSATCYDPHCQEGGAESGERFWMCKIVVNNKSHSLSCSYCLYWFRDEGFLAVPRRLASFSNGWTLAMQAKLQSNRDFRLMHHLSQI